MNYYLIYGDGHPNHPLLDWEKGSQYFRKCRPATVPVDVQCAVRVGYPIPDTIALPDYLGLPRPVVSTRLRQAIEGIGARTVQFIPVDLHVPDGEIIRDRYHHMHIAYKYEVVDLENSDYTLNTFGKPTAFSKLALSESKLTAIDDADARIFCIAEVRSLRLYREDIVSAMQAIDASGCRYVAVDQFGPGSAFAG